MIRFFLLVLSTVSLACGRWFVVKHFIQQSNINSLTVIHCYRDGFDRELTVWAQELNKIFPGPVTYIDSGQLNRTKSLPITARSLYRMGLVLNLECTNHHPSFLRQASQMDHFNSSYRWLLIGVDNLTRSRGLLDNLNINIDAYITLAVRRDGSLNVYAVYDVYGSVQLRGGFLNIDYLGNCTPTSGWVKASRNREDLQQIELRAVVSSLNQHQPDSIEKYLNSVPVKPRAYNAPKFAYQLAKILQMKLNFRLKFVLASSWRLDVIGTNSSLGVIGQLQSKQVDLSLTPLAVQPERITIYEPTIEIARLKFYTIFRHPKNVLERNIFLAPFRSMIWITIAILLCCITTLLTVVFVVERRTTNALSVALLITLGVLAQQPVVPGRNAFTGEKLILLAMFGCCMLLFQYYSSFIIGYQLIVQPKTINTLEQLIAAGMPVSIENAYYNRDFFMRTKDPIAIELYRRRILPNKDAYLNVSAGIALVRQGGHAFHCDTSYGYTHVSESFTERQVCELQYVTLYPHRVTHIPLVKGSTLKELFKVQLQIIREAGILAYQQARYHAPRPRCVKDSHRTEPVQLFDVVSAFLLLATGIICSCFLLLVELIFRCVQLRSRRQRVPLDFAAMT